MDIVGCHDRQSHSVLSTSVFSFSCSWTVALNISTLISNCSFSQLFMCYTSTLLTLKQPRMTSYDGVILLYNRLFKTDIRNCTNFYLIKVLNVNYYFHTSTVKTFSYGTYQSHKHNKCRAEFTFHVILMLKSMLFGIE